MSLLNKNLSATCGNVVIDRSIIKWSGFYTTSREAEENFEHQIDILSKKYNIQTKEIKFVNRHFRGYFLYNFFVTVITLSS